MYSLGRQANPAAPPTKKNRLRRAPPRPQLYALLDKGCTPLSFFAPYIPIPQHINRDRSRLEMVKVRARTLHDRHRGSDRGRR